MTSFCRPAPSIRRNYSCCPAWGLSNSYANTTSALSCLTALRAQIKPLVDSAAVGRNLHDHLFLPLYYTLNDSSAMSYADTVFTRPLVALQHIISYVRMGTGLLAASRNHDY